MRTEEEILRDLSKLGWEPITRTDKQITLFNLKKGTRIFIYLKSKNIFFQEKVNFKTFTLICDLVNSLGWWI